MVELSVIIPTRNRAALLRRCLEGLTRQYAGCTTFEVLVVDNGSSDETAAVVAELQQRSDLPLQLLHEPRPGLHRARHCGLKAARGAYLVFADDDIVPDPGWLSAIGEAFAAEGVMLVGGRNLPDWESPPPRWLASLWERHHSIGALSVLDLGGEPKSIDPQWVWGCNFSIARAVLEEAKGFHPDAMPDELLRFRGDGESYVTRHVAQKGHRALYHPGASVRHFVPAHRMTFDYFQRRAFAQGVSNSFTDLREGAAPAASSRWRDHFARFAGRRSIDLVLRTLMPGPLYLRAAVATATLRGYQWHQEQFRQDEALRKWVMAADYLD